MISTEVGNKIRDLRLIRGLTQEQLAEMLYRKKNTISQYENGKINIRVDDLEQIAEVLNTDISYFFQNDSGKPYEANEVNMVLTKIVDPRFRQEAVDILKTISRTELLFLPAGSV